MTKQAGPRRRSHSKAVASREVSPDCHDGLLVETPEGSGIPPKSLSDHDISGLSLVQTGEQMTSPEHNGKAALGNSIEVDAAHAVEGHDEAHDRTNEAVTVAATVGVVAVGAFRDRAAARHRPRRRRDAGAEIRAEGRSGRDADVPLTVRGAYKLGQKTREMVAEAKEQVHDIVAEVHAEGDTVKAASKTAAEPPNV